ncbi:MAG: MarR family transcriptional regulator, partial [Burkholderia sp.]
MDESLSQPALPVSERVLNVLKRRGPQQSAELGACLGTTSETARQQLKKLEADGLVEAENVPQGVGRSARVWRLTALGHGHFPDAHADMTLDPLIRAREAEMRETYARALAGVTGLEARIARLVELRDRDDFDLTLADSSDAICFCAAAALTDMGQAVPPRERIEASIGLTLE